MDFDTFKHLVHQRVADMRRDSSRRPPKLKVLYEEIAHLAISSKWNVLAAHLKNDRLEMTADEVEPLIHQALHNLGRPLVERPDVDLDSIMDTDAVLSVLGHELMRRERESGVPLHDVREHTHHEEHVQKMRGKWVSAWRDGTWYGAASSMGAPRDHHQIMRLKCIGELLLWRSKVQNFIDPLGAACFIADGLVADGFLRRLRTLLQVSGYGLARRLAVPLPSSYWDVLRATFDESECQRLVDQLSNDATLDWNDPRYRKAAGAFKDSHELHGRFAASLGLELRLATFAATAIRS